MKIYVAGSISNNKNYKEDFAKAVNKLRTEGHIVLDPSTLPGGLSQQDYMSICIAMLYCCEAIYMLKGWKSSVGATIEHALAKQSNKIIYYESEDIL